MRILFIADGRSPTAQNWMDYFIQGEHEVHLISNYVCKPIDGLASLNFIPLAFSSAVEIGAETSFLSIVINQIATPQLRTILRQWFVPSSLTKAAAHLDLLAWRVKPDIIHAMRIPYEGMLASKVELPAPLLVSVWGNDFTLHAKATRTLAKLTRKTLARTDAIHTDCKRDLSLAFDLGFDSSKPSIILPGGGGVNKEIFYPSEANRNMQQPVIVNPRGFRAYVRNDTFFKSIPGVLQRFPNARFICPAMQNQQTAHQWVARLGIQDSVDLLQPLSKPGLAAIYHRAQIIVSPTTHDGTPNSVLEAMACGCFPIVSDLESLREWITPGENGLMFNPEDHEELTQTILRALLRPKLIQMAGKVNHQVIMDRADYQAVMKKALNFYNLVKSKNKEEEASDEGGSPR